MRAFTRLRTRTHIVAAATTKQVRSNATSTNSNNGGFSADEIAGFGDIPPAPPVNTTAGSGANNSSGWDDDGMYDDEANKGVWGGASSAATGNGWFNDNAAASGGGRWGSSADTSSTAGGRWGASAAGGSSAATGGWGASASAAAPSSSSWGNLASEGANTAAASSSSGYGVAEADMMAKDFMANNGANNNAAMMEGDGEGEEGSGSFADEEGFGDEFADEEEHAVGNFDGAAAVAAAGGVLGAAAAAFAGLEKSPALAAVKSNNNQGKRNFQSGKTAATDRQRAALYDAEAAQMASVTDVNATAMQGVPEAEEATETNEDGAPMMKARTLGPQPTVTKNLGPIDVAARYEPRLATLPNASVDAIMAIQPEDAVNFTASYIHMQHFIRNCRRRRVKFVNPVYLSTLKEEALLSAAIKAIETRAVPLDLAIKVLRAPYLFERMMRYRRYLSTLIRGWVVETILADQLTPPLARKCLLIAHHFGRDARVVGSLAQKAIADIETVPTAQLIKSMYAIADTHVKPPASYWSVVLRQIAKNMHAANAAEAEREAAKKAGEEVAPTTPQLRPLTVRDCYRVLDCCARVGVFADINMLAQLSEHAWRLIARNAECANYPERKQLRSRAALARLERVTSLGPNQFFRLIQITSTLGTNFNAGRGVITDNILVPLIFHLNDHHVSECIEALAVSKTRYAPALQAVIDRVVYRGANSPASLMHVTRILRTISHHNDVCAQLRLAKFFDLLESVCSQKQILRCVQMTRLVEDIYYITRRFARTAPIVVRMQKIVELFCGNLVNATKRGVVSIDQINSVLEHTVMLGMSKDHEQFPNVKALRDLRKDLYKDTKAGAYPSGYKNVTDPSVRFLYNDLVYINQTQSLFQQQVDRGALAQLQQLVTAAGPKNTLKAIMIYNELHGQAMPLSPFLDGMLTKYYRHVLLDVKTGDSLQTISKKLYYGRDHVMTTPDLIFFASALRRKSLTTLKHSAFYLQFLDAAAIALGGNEAVQEMVGNFQKHALY